ncbi:MAG: hypothetical protein HFG58_07220 [Lachnospiraceae bacterium]|nr:hypothetical protein [Lachnospiraceae bacterium]
MIRTAAIPTTMILVVMIPDRMIRIRAIPETAAMILITEAEAPQRAEAVRIPEAQAVTIPPVPVRPVTGRGVLREATVEAVPTAVLREVTAEAVPAAGRTAAVREAVSQEAALPAAAVREAALRAAARTAAAVLPAAAEAPAGTAVPPAAESSRHRFPATESAW